MREERVKALTGAVVRPAAENPPGAGQEGAAWDPAADLRRGRWQLADTWIPFPAQRLPAGGVGTGRLVTIHVQTASRARLSDRRPPGSRGPGPLVVTDLAGEVRLESGYLHVRVYASAFAVLSVAALAGVFILGGLSFFLGTPRVGTAIVGLALVTAGGWLLAQLPGLGREVAEDAARVLGLMLRETASAEAARVHP